MNIISHIGTYTFWFGFIAGVAYSAFWMWFWLGRTLRKRQEPKP